MTQPPGAGPDFTPPGFEDCYRHPGRPTGIRCQRCRKPICGECMQTASVGFQCPRCAGAGRASTRTPRTAFGAAIRPGGGRATTALMAVLGGLWVIDLVGRGLASQLLVMSNSEVYVGQFWRLVTASVTSGPILGVLMNLLVLWIAGRAIESEVGGWRFILLYLVAGLGGTTLLFVLAPFSSAGYGASAAVLGLLGANAVFKHKTKEDVRADLGLFVLLILYGVLVGFRGYGWLMLIGGILAGAVGGAVLAYAPRRNRAAVQLAGLLGLVLLCAAAVATKLVLL